MISSSHLAEQFLIAMPALRDPNFARTVTYLCQHNEDGAMGIVVNRPMEITLGEILTQMDIEVAAAGLSDAPVYLGGPVQAGRGFVLHEPADEWDSTLRVAPDIGITTSRDILVAMACGEGPKRSLVALGYAGWAAGQLEQELAENVWLSGPADRAILFDTSCDQRWRAAAQSIGVDITMLSADAGHA